MQFTLRNAIHADTQTLEELIRQSVRVLQKDDYTSEELEGALVSVYGVDSQLIEDGTYFVVETNSEIDREIVGCGGWSKRKTLFGGDNYAGREDNYLDPKLDAAKIRAFFIKPGHTRKGIGTMLLDHCESEAAKQGFKKLEMGATLTGVALYKARGYREVEAMAVPLSNGHSLAIVKMTRDL